MRNHLTNTRLKKYQFDINKYLDNMYAAQKIIPKLHIFEITLRNKIDRFFKSNINKNWLVLIHSNSFPIHMSPYALSTLSKIVNELKKLKKPITNDNIISNITLGFWINLFSQNYITSYRKYNKHQCNAFIREITGLQKTTNATEVLIHTELAEIRDFRNRVFHYERVIHLISNAEKLIDKYLIHFEKKNEITNFLKKTNIYKKIPTTKGKFRKKRTR